MPTAINNALMRLEKRAETNAPQKLAATFVDVGPLFTLLSTNGNQILYGRRGTGKTHALIFLRERRREVGDPTVYVDLRSVGSNGGLYSDGMVPISERATRLLIDVMGDVHEGLYEFFIDHEEFNLAKAGPLLDQLLDELSNVKVVGGVELVAATKYGESKTELTKAGLDLTPRSLGASAGLESSSKIDQGAESSVKRIGEEFCNVRFGSIGSVLRSIMGLMPGKRIWVLLDEWSSIPLDLQPYLADFIRRALFPVPGVTVKIAAIEHRSRFRITRGNDRDYIGVELGADIAADLNLDDYMVFDNDANKSVEFFSRLLYRHIIEVDEVEQSRLPNTPEELIRDGFTQRNAFMEFVRAAEGVPRDAINIIAKAAQSALDDAISVNIVRSASRRWYDYDKRAAVNSNSKGMMLLSWIIDEVIGARKARAFLVKSDIRYDLIEYLFDARVLHILKKSISSNESPGVRYDVYKLDYGCYVDLINTARAPQGDLASYSPSGGVGYQDVSEVPDDDYRAIRRAVLDMDEFEKNAMG